MISLLVVNYRSALLAVDAIRSARATTKHPLHVIVVDNSCDADEADCLRPHADVLLAAPRNLGYAGAINAGRPHCRGEVVVAANPDIIFFDGAIDRLCEALDDSRRAVAGPALYWDDERQWILPPGDARTLTDKADQILASRAVAWAGRRDRRRFRERVAFWSLRDATPVVALSGAVMAIRLRDFDDAGGFDERFLLYYEETDFLRRMNRAGRDIVYVPAARCRHIYNQSAGAEGDRAATLFAASELAYFSKWYGPRMARFARSLERPPAHPVFELCHGTFEIPRPDLVVEVSPLPHFATAAGHFARSTRICLPPEVLRSFRGEALYLRALDAATGEVVAACALSSRA